MEYKPRIEERTKVMVRARLRAERGECDACILDISTRGLAATAATPPARGEFVEFRIGKNTIVGHVKWSGERRFGIAFRERVSVIAAISGEGDLVMRTRSGARRQGQDRRRPAEHQASGRKAEFAIMAAGAAVAMVFLGSYVATALGALDTVEIVLSDAKAKG